MNRDNRISCLNADAFSPEKAGVGGSIPSLATILNILQATPNPKLSAMSAKLWSAYVSDRSNRQRKSGEGCIQLRQGRYWILLLSNRRKGSRGPNQRFFSLGTIDELPTRRDAEAAAAYVRQVGPRTIAGLLRQRHTPQGHDRPKFSAAWFMEKLKEQDYKCAICHRSPKRLFVDHDHDDGQNRGLLCSCCNSGIGMLKDDIALLRAAIAYLESYGK
jgi:hypothetical protein